MQVKKFDSKEHYEICKGWWDSLGGDWIAPPLHILPADGFIAFYEGIPIAAMFLYTSDNSCMGFMAWTISDLTSNPTIRAGALVQLNKAIQDFGVTKGLKGIFASAPSDKLERLFTKFGYTVCEKATVMAIDLKKE